MQPDISDEEIGMRSFQLKKQKATEIAIDKIRYHLADEWSVLSSKEIELLEWVLGDVWAYIARGEWDRISFSELKLSDLYQIIDIAKQIIAHKKIGSVGLNEVHKLVKKYSEEEEEEYEEEEEEE